MSFGARDLSVGCPLFGSIASTGIAVGTSTVVRYSGDVRYWECPLSEVPLYISVFGIYWNEYTHCACMSKETATLGGVVLIIP